MRKQFQENDRIEKQFSVWKFGSLEPICNLIVKKQTNNQTTMEFIVIHYLCPCPHARTWRNNVNPFRMAIRKSS